MKERKNVEIKQYLHEIKYTKAKRQTLANRPFSVIGSLLWNDIPCEIKERVQKVKGISH